MGETTSESPPHFFTVEEAADNLRISITTLRRYLREGSIRGVQPAGKGGVILIPAEALKPENLAPVWNCTTVTTTTTPTPVGTTSSVFDPNCRKPKWAWDLSPSLGN